MDKEVHINILPYLPQISEATILGEVFFSDYKGVLLSDITSVQEAQYHHILSVFKMSSKGDFPPYPIKCYASEWNKTEGKGIAYLGSFTEELQQPYNVYHINYGEHENFKEINYFFNVAMKLVKKDLKLKSNVSIEIKEVVINDANIRFKEDILNDYNIDEDRFDIKYKSYEQALIHLSENIGYWNDEIEDFEKKYCTESEVAKARYNLDQAIINRVVCSLHLTG